MRLAQVATAATATSAVAADDTTTEISAAQAAAQAHLTFCEARCLVRAMLRLPIGPEQGKPVGSLCGTVADAVQQPPELYSDLCPFLKLSLIPLLLLLVAHADMFQTLCDVFCLTCIRDPAPARLAHLLASQVLPNNSAQAIDTALANAISRLAPHATELAAAATVMSSSTRLTVGVTDSLHGRLVGRSGSSDVNSYWREAVLPLLAPGSSGN